MNANHNNPYKTVISDLSMPVTLDYMIYKDSVDFIQIVDSSHIQTLAQMFPKFVINPDFPPQNNDSLSFVSYINADGSVALGATIGVNGQRIIGLNTKCGDKNLAWLISYKEDSSKEKYSMETGFVADYIKVQYSEEMPPLQVEQERFSFDGTNLGFLLATSSITYSGAGERAVFCVNEEIKRSLEEIGKAAFGRTQKIINDHKGGEWLRNKKS